MCSRSQKVIALWEANGPIPDLQPACLHAAGFWMHATCSVLHATPPGRSSPGQNASTAAIHVLFPSGENVLLCSQEGNALWERTVRFQPLLPFDRDQSGPAATGSISAVHWMVNPVADLEDDPVADSIVSLRPTSETP